MARQHFHDQLDALQADLVRLGEGTAAVAARFLSLDARAAGERLAEVEADVRSLRALRADIEGRCIALFATQAPVAGDLRRLSSVFNVAADFEAIAEAVLHAARVASGKSTALRSLEPLPALGDTLLETLSHTVRFCQSGDPAHAAFVRGSSGSSGIESLEAALVASITSVEEASERLPLLRLASELERVFDLCRRIVARMEFALPGPRAAAAAP